MALTSDYPNNWAEIASAIKLAAGYRCRRCSLKCLPPTDSYRHLDLSLRRRLSAQVHHIDHNPACNDRSNLVCHTLGSIEAKCRSGIARRSGTFDRSGQSDVYPQISPESGQAVELQWYWSTDRQNRDPDLTHHLYNEITIYPESDYA